MQHIVADIPVYTYYGLKCVLNPQSVGIWRLDFVEVIRLRLGHEGGTLMLGFLVLF